MRQPRVSFDLPAGPRFATPRRSGSVRGGAGIARGPHLHLPLPAKPESHSTMRASTSLAVLASLAAIALVSNPSALPSLLTGKSSPRANTEVVHTGSDPLAADRTIDAVLPKGDSVAIPAPNDSKLKIELDLAVAVKLQRAGVYPSALTAAGLTALEAAQVINRAKDHFAADSSLAAADAAVAEVKPTIEPLASKVKVGKATYEEALALSAAREALTAAETAQATALANALAAATAGTTEAQQQTLIRIQQNSHWRLPTQFLVLEQEEAAWVLLRNALDGVTAATSEGWSPADSALALIEHTRQQPAVASAEQGLASHLAELQAAWDSAVQQ